MTCGKPGSGSYNPPLKRRVRLRKSMQIQVLTSIAPVITASYLLSANFKLRAPSLGDAHEYLHEGLRPLILRFPRAVPRRPRQAEEEQVKAARSRLLACDGAGLAFKYKDYRVDGHVRQKAMRLATDEFIRRFLIHVLPTGFYRVRHYGLFASGVRAYNIAHARELLGQSTLFPECLEDWICEDNPVRVIDVFVGRLDLAELLLATVAFGPSPVRHRNKSRD
jgi:hypothetical protein